MAFACVLKNPRYLLNPIPQLSYTAEIEAMEPMILNGDIELLAVINNMGLKKRLF